MKHCGSKTSPWTAWLAVLLAVWVGGCASQREPDWNSMIGKLTYDEAVLQLGPASRLATLEDGTTVGVWLQFSSRVYSVPGGPVGPGPWGGWGGWGGGGWSGGSVNSTPNVYRMLTFGPDHKLVSFRRLYQ